MQIVKGVVAIAVLLMLVACAQAPQQPQVPEPVPEEPTPSAPQEPAPAQPSTPTPDEAPTDVQGTPGCPTTAARVQYHCQLDVMPEQGDDCTFNIPSDSFGSPGGEVTYTKVSGTVDDYVAAYEEIYAGDETYELKPRSTRREKAPYSYFFWFTGDSVITMKGTTRLCPSDRLKKLLVEMESGILDVPREAFCGISTQGACVVDADCVVSGCSSQVCGAKEEEAQMTTCEDRACYKAKNFGLSCRCMQRECQWG